MSRALHDVATGTLFGVALNYQGLLKQRLAEFEQPPYQKPPVKPVLFIKTPNTRNRHDADVVHPGHGQRLQPGPRSEEHKSELKSLMRISYADICLKKESNTNTNKNTVTNS